MSLSTDLRKYYYPIGAMAADKGLGHPEVDRVCELLYNEFQQKNPNLQVINEDVYDLLYENSYNVKDLLDARDEENIFMEELVDNIDTFRFEESNRSDFVELFQIKPPTGTNWSDMFTAITKLRISNDYRMGNYQYSATSYGRPNVEVINCMPNNGGCGLTALFALGIISLKTYLTSLCDMVTLHKDFGTVGKTLYSILLNQKVNISSTPASSGATHQGFIKQFVILSGTLGKKRQIKTMIDYINLTLVNNNATILRFGDRNLTDERLDESLMGHSIVVYKENHILYMFDGWAASKLTVKSKYDTRNVLLPTTYTAKSMSTAIGIAPITELTVDSIVAEMVEVGHDYRIGTIFEVICVKDKHIFESDFDKRTAEQVIDKMRIIYNSKFAPNSKFKKAAKKVIAKTKAVDVDDINVEMPSHSSAASVSDVDIFGQELKPTIPSVQMNRTAEAVSSTMVQENPYIQCINDVCTFFMGKGKSKHNKRVYKNKTHKNSKNKTKKRNLKIIHV
jgi:hypothetical protein